MSESTPPPCCVGSQNHALCGPACSSAARARERSHRERDAAQLPQCVLYRLHVDLIFEVGLGCADSPCQFEHPIGLDEIARERLFDDEPFELCPARNRISRLFERGDAREVRAEECEHVDVLREARDVAMDRAGAETVVAYELRELLGRCARMESDNLDAAHARERAQLEVRDETAADDAVAQSHVSRPMRRLAA